VERQETRLNIRLIPDSPDHLLILEEEKTAVDYAGLQGLGLTRREAEVFHWVSEGKTNVEIGGILHSSLRTVGKHLERIFEKLDVDTRTAAATAPRLAAKGALSSVRLKKGTRYTFPKQLEHFHSMASRVRQMILGGGRPVPPPEPRLSRSEATVGA
jgi:DNA-binding CsgD family transcriptional regulator